MFSTVMDYIYSGDVVSVLLSICGVAGSILGASLFWLFVSGHEKKSYNKGLISVLSLLLGLVIAAFVVSPSEKHYYTKALETLNKIQPSSKSDMDKKNELLSKINKVLERK